jgi:hypothetical protein
MGHSGRSVSRTGMQASKEILLMFGRKALQNLSSHKREKYIFWKKCGIRQEGNINEASKRSSVGAKISSVT